MLRIDQFVQWIKDLHSHANCSPYFHELLASITDDMLRINPNERERSDALARKLHIMANRCRSESAYTSPSMGKHDSFDDDVSASRAGGK